MMWCCEKCKFVFESVQLMEHCPDCGYGPVREATIDEKNDYVANRQKYGPMPVYGISNLCVAHEVEMPVLISVNNGCPVFKVYRSMVPAVLM